MKSSTKILGFNFNSKLSTASSHNQSIHSSKLSQQHISRFWPCPNSIKRLLYLSLVRSHLVYCPCIYLTGTKASQLQAQRIQNKSITWINDTKWYDYRRMTDLHEETNIKALNIHRFNLFTNTFKFNQLSLFPYFQTISNSLAMIGPPVRNAPFRKNTTLYQLSNSNPNPLVT